MLLKIACTALTYCYFCGMNFLNNKIAYFFCFGAVCILSSCSTFFKDETKKESLARVGDTYLYKEDIEGLIPSGMSKRDSAAFVVNYINNWASKELLLGKSKINLPQEKLAAYNKLVSNYKTDLYTKAYLEALVQQSLDTVISESELKGFYSLEKENFKLREKLVQLRFVALPLQFLNKQEIKTKLKNFKKEDKDYLDSIAVQFKKLHFNDSIWVSMSRLIEEISPLTSINEDKYLKKSQFFELQDSMGVYLGKVNKVLYVNDIAPMSYVTPDIKQIIMNRRRRMQIKKIETEIIDEAIKEKEFEVYEKD